LNSPYKRIAADANQSNTTTAFDMVEIRKMLLFIDTVYTSNLSWRFIDASYTFINPNQPYSEEYPEFISINGLAEDRDDINFVAIKIGDVNVSHNPSQLTSGDTRSEEPGFVLKTEDLLLEAGETYTIPMLANSWEDIKGFQFALELNQEKGELLEVELNESAENKGLRIENFGKSNIEQGILTASWVNSSSWNQKDSLILFNIKIRCIETSHLSEILKMNSNLLLNESYLEIAPGEIKPVSFNLEFLTNQKRDLPGIKTYQSYPNPVQNYTKVGFELEEGTCMEFILVNALGQKIWSHAECYEKGFHEISMDRSIFGKGRGVYYGKMSDSKEWTNTWKIIVAE